MMTLSTLCTVGLLILGAVVLAVVGMLALLIWLYEPKYSDSRHWRPPVE